MKKGKLITSIGFTEHGVSENISVIPEVKDYVINIALKTASGFGGCNAAITFQSTKNE